MLSNIVASSEDLTVLTRILDDFCVANGIADADQRSMLARSLIDLFGDGVQSEAGLRAGLSRLAGSSFAA
ncbi:hypothetical protein DK058_25695 [Salmonella enterica subsp. enterica serovar Typhi]|nr:hypothetical protein [Salmonella enterica subsp. enterica]EBU7498267.1 hypothetical protein [Salmonella enterica subsp. enterica serovar Typhi]MIL09575.1 hypothetical protein [Salmonella enterica subsp. enterica serovar Enteritidis]